MYSCVSCLSYHLQERNTQEETLPGTLIVYLHFSEKILFFKKKIKDEEVSNFFSAFCDSSASHTCAIFFFLFFFWHSGLVGRSYAMLFASAGYDVRVYDASKEQLQRAVADMEQQLSALAADGLQRGCLTVQQTMAHVTATDSLEDCVTGARYIQVMHATCPGS